MARARSCLTGRRRYNGMPKLFGYLAFTRDGEGSIVLHDLNPSALEDIQRYGRKAMAQAGANFNIETTTDLERALDGAEFVVVTITTGGLDTMARDLGIPERYGIYQSVGDTVGPGGLSRALRNVPVMVGIAQAMQRNCPDAWMLNLTNPLTVLTRVVGLTTPRLKVMGLCHELFGVRGALIRMFGGSEQDFEMRVAGVNHLIWLLDMTIRGQDGLQMVRDFVRQGREVPLPPSRGDWHEPFVDRWKLKLELFDVYGALPAAGDRHLAEFFAYFLTAETQPGADYGRPLTTVPPRRAPRPSARADVRAAIEGELPPLSRSPEATAAIVSAVANGRSVRTIVNLPNTGQIDELPRGAVVEPLAEITSVGAQPLTVGAVPPGVLSTLQPHAANQEMIAVAALEGDRQLALQAMLNDPLVPSLQVARALLNDLLEAHAEHLPQFRSRVAVAA